MAIEVDTSLYDRAAVCRACYKLSDRAYFFLSRDEKQPAILCVASWARTPEADLSRIVGEFCDELIDQQLRENLQKEAGALRELIVAQAFAEGNLLDENRDAGDYEADPLDIGSSR